MLEVTSSAASTLAAARVDEGLPDHFVARFFARTSPPGNTESSSRLGFGFVEAPHANDRVAETDGTRVFIAPEVIPMVEHSVLDTEERGYLVLRPQPR